jgi:DHA2 family multidrug resistance protein
VSAAAVQAPAERRAHNRWAIALTVTLATFMELLDTSISNVSLPHIAGGLGTSYDESTWILTSYLVANAIILPMSAWLSQVFGRKRYYMMSVALFTATSLLCGVAPSLAMLIVFRVLQGIGGGGLAPVEQAILVDTFPKEKLGGAFALYSMAIVTAPAIGPPLGGWITDSFSWRWVFFINVPIGLISLLLSSRLVRDPAEFTEERKQARRGGHLRIDYVGIVLIAIGFACLEVVLDRGERDDWLGSHFITSFLLIAIVAITIAIWWEWHHHDPVVELTLLRERNFAISNLYYFLFAFGLFGSTVLIPEMLQNPLWLHGDGRGAGARSRCRGYYCPGALCRSDRAAGRRQTASWSEFHDRRAFNVLLQRSHYADRLFSLRAGALLSGFRLRLHVRSREPARVLVPAQEQEQQRV